ncbi:hypothetical protein CBF34_07410 [Vagococcus penaei]|uniref:Uncharacterized protein n=2 Tax=Vagococcus penaei TaxID=633807 RepID=A0A1Q2D382_9ENTE|nr:hypothetical protein BW732_00275 [Vagococcus penaei]RSU01145.1 hypothetical protein CBF34_07410 [Vagococcus penaei]
MIINKRLKKLILVLMSLIFITGCGMSKTKSKAAEEKPQVIKIGVINVPNDKQVAITQGFFDKSFKEKGIKTEFLFFDSGVAANQALASNSIDFAEMGYTNAVVALANDLPAKLIWIHEVLGSNEALVVRNGSNVENIKQLAGKKIATPFSSTSHYSLLQALNEAGLSEKDVTLLDMQTSEIVAAWSRGDIDAAYTWKPTLSELEKTGKVIIDSDDLAQKGYVTTNIELVNSHFAEKYPELVVDYLSVLNEGVNFYLHDYPLAIKGMATKQNLSYQEIDDQVQGTTWLINYAQLSPDYLGNEKETGNFQKVFYDTAIFLKDQGSIKDVPTKEKIDSFIDKSYNLKINSIESN